jgi:hypothetical protein
MNDAVPDDIAREKQRELGQQLTWTEGELAKLEVKEADVRRLLDAALKLAGNCQTGSGRRSNNRSGSNVELLVGVRGLEPLTSRV